MAVIETKIGSTRPLPYLKIQCTAEVLISKGPPGNFSAQTYSLLIFQFAQKVSKTQRNISQIMSTPPLTINDALY